MTNKKLRGLTTIEALLIAAAFILVGVIGILVMTNMGQSAAAQPRVQVQATYGAGVLTATIEVLSGQINGVQLQYWQVGGQPGQPLNTDQCYKGGVQASWPVYQGQSVTCYWQLNTEPGKRYQYIIYIFDASGRQVQVARGVFTAGVT